MGVIESEFNREVARSVDRAQALGLDLEKLRKRATVSTPAELASPEEKQNRKRLLDALYETPKEANLAFERVLAGNELQDVNFLERGSLVAEAVMRIILRRPGGGIAGYGTGFLIGDSLLITNNHVLPSSNDAARAEAQARYEFDVSGAERRSALFELKPEEFFYTSEALDFSLVAVAPIDKSGQVSLSVFGWLPLIGTPGKAAEGEWLTIIQHPEGEHKQLCVRENQLLKRDGDVLWYSSDTQPGSSGSPVFNNDWLVVALHHSGVPKIVNGKWQTVDGRDYDAARDGEDRVDWLANEGIRVSRIIEHLQSDAQLAQQPKVAALLRTGVGDIVDRLPVIYPHGAGTSPTTSSPQAILKPKEKNMASRRVNVTIEIDEQGNAQIVGHGGGLRESFALEKSSSSEKKNIIEAPVDPQRDWKGGFDSKFLGAGNLQVNLPQAPAHKIAPLIDAYGQTFTPAQRKAGELKYKGFSVVMNKDRCLAFFSAANVDGSMRPNISGRKDDWLFDDRIDRAFQLDNSYYKNDQFDRGHLTRRDDMEWGTDPRDAVNRANGTCTWTNCTPQHKIFNQGKEPGILLWQQLEKYVLEQTAAENSFKMQVFTGPVFGAADPKFRDFAYPLDFWKVVVAVNAKGKLFATAYLLSQEETIAKHGLDEAALEQPFGKFGTYQKPISKIEELTGLKFTYGAAAKPLSEVDPLANGASGSAKKKKASGANEAFGLAGDDDALMDLSDIILE